MLPVYDITINGSLITEARSEADAKIAGCRVSKERPTRLVRVHGIDGMSVVAAYRNGQPVPQTTNVGRSLIHDTYTNYSDDGDE